MRSFYPRTAIAAFLLFAASLLAIYGLSAPSQAAPTAEQRTEIQRISTEIRKAGNFFRQKKYRESAEVVRAAQADLDNLAEAAAGDLSIYRLVKPLYDSLSKAHALLELEGFELLPLNVPEEPEAAPPMPRTPRNAPNAPPAGNEVSFTRQVAPILLTKCGNCHTTNSRGEFNTGTFANLSRGAGGNRVVVPGDGEGSRLVEVIESGDMPRGGQRVSPQELALLKRWIAEGAKFDGNDQNAPLANLQAGAAPMPADPMMAAPMPIAAERPKGTETVSYALEVAPILAANCLDCHGMNQPRAGLSLANFERLLRGGDSGAMIAPGNPDTSLLVQKLKGTADGARMPMNRPPLPTDQIAKIETWIREGAKFDGPQPGMATEQVAALARATAASPEELSAERQQSALARWNKTIPGGAAPQQVATDHFLLLGNVGDATLANIGKEAEAQLERVRQILKIDESEPFLRGRMTLFVFEQRYDYSEFGQMTEQRQLPREWRGHWNYTIIDAYAAFVPPRGDEYALDALLAHQIAGVYVASQGQAPRWLAEGVGRVVAERVNNKDARVTQWKDQLPSIIPRMARPDDGIMNKLSPEDGDVANYSLADSLLSNARGFQQLLKSLKQGQDFDAAFMAAYRQTPAQAADAWYRKAAARRGR